MLMFRLKFDIYTIPSVEKMPPVPLHLQSSQNRYVIRIIPFKQTHIIFPLMKKQA